MKGYQKKVIYMKNTGSRHFEEAYFVLRSDTERKNVSCNEMVEEANKIIAENFDQGKGGFLYTGRWYILAFLVGCALTFAVCSIIGLSLR